MRTVGILTLLLIALSLTYPLAESYSSSGAVPNIQTSPVVHSADPFGSTTAFNASYAAINTYSGTGPGVNVTNPPSAGTLTQPDANQWKFKLTTTTASIGREEINWTLQVLGSVRVCTLCTRVILRFVFFTPAGDTIDTGGNASYVIYRSTTATPTLARVFGTGTSENDTQTISNSTRTRSVASFCPDANEICYDATNSIGYNLTLAFKFGWNFVAGPSKMLSVQVGNVALLAPNLVNANVHQMVLNPVTNKVLHTANVTSFNFNRTVTTPLPSPPGGNKDFNWTMFEVTLYYPTPYSGFTASNATGALPAGTTGFCSSADCKSLFNSTFVSMSFSSQLKGNFQLTLTAQTTNTLRSIATVVGNLPETHWQPGESIGVKLNDTLAINQAGTLSITQIHSSGKTIGPTQTQNTLGSGVFPISAATTPLGNWNLNATFTSLYDYGSNSAGIFLEHLKLAQGFTYSGDNSRITASGTVDSESLTIVPSASASVAVFAISTLTSGNYSRSFAPATAGLYIHNVTFVNGAFTSGRPLIMFLGIDNPSSTAMVGNVTISHEFISNQPNGVNATFSLDKPIDTPFAERSRIYEVDVTFSNGLMNIRVTTLRTGAQTTVTSGAGSPPLFDTRQQFGMFNIIVTSQPQAGGLRTSNSRESQPFAYLFTNSLIALGGRVLAAQIGNADGQGAFTLTTDPAPIPQARHLVLLVLARDANGITLGNQDPTGATDSLVLCGPSSTCQPSLDGPTEATRGQSLTMTLKVRNNSTKLVMNLNITLQVFSGATLLSQTTPISGTMQPGAAHDFPFSFTAPSNLGVYTVSFFSAQYGSPILVTTLNVVLIPTSVQIAIPVIIGVAVAVGLIIFFRTRKPAITETSEKAKAMAQRTGPKPRNP